MSQPVRDAAQAFDFVIAKIRSYSNESQRAGFEAAAFGKEAGPKLAGFVDAGANAIADLEAKARSLGIVLNSQTVSAATEAKSKLDTLFQVIETQGVVAVSRLAPEIATLAQNITDSLPSLIAWVEHWADWFGLIKESPLAKLQYDVDQAKAHVDELVKKMNAPWYLKPAANLLDPQIKQAIADYKSAQKAKAAYESDNANRYDTHLAINPFAKPKLKINDIQGNKDAEEQAQQRKEMLDKIGVDQATADAALTAEQNKLAVQLLQGQAGYYDAVKTQIADDLAAKITAINAEEQKQLDSWNKQKVGQAGFAEFKTKAEAEAAAKIKTAQTEAAAQTDLTGSGGLVRDANTTANKQIQSYKDQIANLGLIDGALASATFMQNELNDARDKGLLNEAKGIYLDPQVVADLKARAIAVGQAAQAEADAAKIMQNSIQVQDDLRTGLEDIGTAGLNGFKSMKEAAQQFLESLAQLILKLYVMKPLVEGLLGPAGGNGGGLLGSGLGSFLNSGGAGSPAASGALSAGTSLATAAAGSVSTDAAGATLLTAGTSLTAAAAALSAAAATLGATSATSGVSGLAGIGASLATAANGGVFVPGAGMRNLRRFAGGGVSKDAAIFGEAGPEAAVPLPDGRSIPVSIKIPSMAKLRGTSQPMNITAPVYVTQSLAGAIDADGVSRIAQQQAVSMGVEVAKQMKKQLPALMAQAFQDKL